MPKSPAKPLAKPTTRSLQKALAQSLMRSTSAVVPPAYQFLFDKARYLVCHGGRGAGRSWSFARALILAAQDKRCRILCAREFQSSISESVHRLLADQIDLLGYGDFFEVQANTIIGRNDSVFIFEGLRHNVSKIKSLEGLTHVWVEEAEAVSEHSWSTLIPTVRKSGSSIFVTYNPHLASDPTHQRFAIKPPPNAIVRKTTFRDNPFFPQELEDERVYLQSVDDDSYRWIWEGECRTVSDALILKNKFAVERFDVQDHWSGPHFGLDLGFSRDPSAAVRLYIDDFSKVLYVKSEMWGIDIDVLSQTLEAAIPGISHAVLFTDSSRPETISYLQRNGVPRAVAAEKWSGSINDGVAYLRSFQRIIIDPGCKNFLAEARTYSFKVDRLTGMPLPEVEDKNNHLMDATRYALSPLIRNLPTSGFFSRSALLLKGRATVPQDHGRPDKLFGVVATTDRAASAVGFVIFASSPHYGIPLAIVDYGLAEIDVAMSASWLETVFDRMRAIGTEWNALYRPELYVPCDDFGEAIGARAVEHATAHAFAGELLHVHFIDAEVTKKSLDERASALRPLVNGGEFAKIAQTAFAHHVTHRNVSAQHLLSQILGYRADVRDAPQELLNAFLLGVELARPR